MDSNSVNKSLAQMIVDRAVSRSALRVGSIPLQGQMAENSTLSIIPLGKKGKLLR